MNRDAGFLFVGRVVSAVTTVLVLALMARTATPEQLGVVALGLTVSLALAVLPEAGLNALFIYDIAGRPERTSRLLAAMVAIRAVALPLVFIAIAVLVVVAYPADARTIMIVALGPAIQQVSELARSVFIARRRMAIASGHSIAENVAWATTIAVGVMAGSDLDRTFGAAALVVSAFAVIAFVLVAFLERVRASIPSRADIGALLRQAGPFTAFSALAVVAARMDTVLIGILVPGGIAAAGAYYTIARLAAAAEYLPEAVSRAIYPRLVKDFGSERAAATAILASATRDLTMVGVATPFGFALVGGAVIGLLYGQDFATYLWLLVGFGLAMPFRFIGMLFGWALTGAGLQMLRLQAIAVTVVISLALNVVLLPTIGVAGALVAGVVGWVVNCLLVTPAVLRAFGMVLRLRDIGWALATSAAALAAGAVVRGVIPPPLGDVGAAVVFGVVLAGGMVILRRTPVVTSSGVGAS